MPVPKFVYLFIDILAEERRTIDGELWKNTYKSDRVVRESDEQFFGSCKAL